MLLSSRVARRVKRNGVQRHSRLPSEQHFVLVTRGWQSFMTSQPQAHSRFTGSQLDGWQLPSI